MITAVRVNPGCRSNLASSVVLPLPRKPVSTVTGSREAAAAIEIGLMSMRRGREGRISAALRAQAVNLDGLAFDHEAQGGGAAGNGPGDHGIIEFADRGATRADEELPGMQYFRA